MCGVTGVLDAAEEAVAEAFAIAGEEVPAAYDQALARTANRAEAALVTKARRGAIERYRDRDGHDAHVRGHPPPDVLIKR